MALRLLRTAPLRSCPVTGLFRGRVSVQARHRSRLVGVGWELRFLVSRALMQRVGVVGLRVVRAVRVPSAASEVPTFRVVCGLLFGYRGVCRGGRRAISCPVLQAGRGAGARMRGAGETRMQAPARNLTGFSGAELCARPGLRLVAFLPPRPLLHPGISWT